jgi:hypothetical protein
VRFPSAIPECSEYISLTHDEYEQVRQHPARFAVKPGHVLPEVERIVDHGGTDGRYTVVEKFEKAAEIAAHFDPRARRTSMTAASEGPVDRLEWLIRLATAGERLVSA